MLAMSSTAVPVLDTDGTVRFPLLAARVGCERFAVYERNAFGYSLVSSHDQFGRKVDTMPLDFESEIVHVADTNIASVYESAAALKIGDSTIFLFNDSQKPAMECLRRALQDLRCNPFSGGSGSENQYRDAA